MSRLIAATPLGLLGHWSIRSQEQARRTARAGCTPRAGRRPARLAVARSDPAPLAHGGSAAVAPVAGGVLEVG